MRVRSIRRYVAIGCAAVAIVAMAAVPAAASTVVEPCTRAGTNYSYQLTETSSGGDSIYGYQGTTCTPGQWILSATISGRVGNWYIYLCNSGSGGELTIYFRMWYTNKTQFVLPDKWNQNEDPGWQCDKTYAEPRNKIGSPAPNNWWVEMGTTNSPAYAFPTPSS